MQYEEFLIHGITQPVQAYFWLQYVCSLHFNCNETFSGIMLDEV